MLTSQDRLQAEPEWHSAYSHLITYWLSDESEFESKQWQDIFAFSRVRE